MQNTKLAVSRRYPAFFAMQGNSCVKYNHFISACSFITEYDQMLYEFVIHNNIQWCPQIEYYEFILCLLILSNETARTRGVYRTAMPLSYLINSINGNISQKMLALCVARKFKPDLGHFQTVHNFVIHGNERLVLNLT